MLVVLPDSPQTILVQHHGVRGSIPWMTRYYLQYASSGTPTNSNMIALAASLGANFIANPMTWIGASTTYMGCTATDLTTRTSAIGTYTANSAGSLAGAAGPPQASMLIKHTINVRYKGGHPRNYLPPPDGATIVNSNQWPSATVTGMQTKWDAHVTYINGLVPTGFTLIVAGTLSYFNKALFPTAPHLRTTPVFYPWVSSTAEATVATQRRRTGR